MYLQIVAGMPPYTNGIEIAVAAAIPREFQPVDGGIHIEQAPFHGRGVMIDEQKQIVVWARDIQGIWHGVVAGQCDNSAWCVFRSPPPTTTTKNFPQPTTSFC